MLPAVLGTLAGCDRCSNDEPADDSLRFVLLDRQGRNLIGIGPGQYHPDSVRLFVGGRSDVNEVQQLEIYDNGYGVTLAPIKQAFNGRDDVRAYLRLSARDTDTLDITYTINEGRCFDLMEYNSVFYNRKEMLALNDFGVRIMRKQR
ncbi:hypothetical protein [Hymenobacter oligotrophus]|nr:hypothetical protein [Hymenobacter oligotrophus]